MTSSIEQRARALLPSPKYLAKLSRDGEWAELTVMPDWTAEMWADGTEPVYSEQQMMAVATAALRLEPDPDGTRISHETEPHCCGCYVIHWNSGCPLARCNECGHSEELLALLSNAAIAKATGEA